MTQAPSRVGSSTSQRDYKTSMTPLESNGAASGYSSMPMPEHSDDKDPYQKVKRLNKMAQVGYIVVILIFNVIFWAIAIEEFLRPAEEYLDLY